MMKRSMLAASAMALAAMYLGHDARKAVEVASALDASCGNGIDTLTLDQLDDAGH